MSFLNRFKIPTLLGLTLILTGLIAGVYLTVQNQPLSFSSKASPDLSPQNILITNIEDKSATVTWTTPIKTPGFLTFGINSADENTLVDDRDTGTTAPRTTHHITLKQLTPQTNYKIKLVSGKYTYPQQLQLTTASTANINSLTPVIGTVVAVDTAIDDGIAFLSISSLTPQSAVIKNGNFIIPLGNIRKQDLSDVANLDSDTLIKITVLAAQGKATSIINLSQANKPIGPLKMGQDLDLTTQLASPSATPQEPKFDLNNDGLVNSSDYAIVLKSLGKKGQGVKGDLNYDRVIDKKDLDLMSQAIKNQGSK